MSPEPTGPADSTTLAKAVGLHERSARDFLDPLVAPGMLDRDLDEYYNNRIGFIRPAEPVTGRR